MRFTFIQKWYIRLMLIVIITSFFATMAYAQQEQVKAESTELVKCTNPAGCIGKLNPKLPICSICQFPVSAYSVTTRGDNIAQEIINVLEEARLLDEKILEIKKEKERKLQEKLANRKSYDLAYAQKVLRNAIEFRNAKERTFQHLKSGKKGVEGSLISGTHRGKLTWKKEEDFILHPTNVR